MAILLVVLAHAGVPFLAGGFVGVDVFFVLSGFLITGLLLARSRPRGGSSLREFYVRRARRILPAAVLTLVVTDLVARPAAQLRPRARRRSSTASGLRCFARERPFAQARSDYFAAGPAALPAAALLVALGRGAVLSRLAAPARARALRHRCAAAAACRGALEPLCDRPRSAAPRSPGRSTRHRGSPIAAYFSTFSRAWELASVLPSRSSGARLARMPAHCAGGEAALGLALHRRGRGAFSSGTAFPGYAALLPGRRTPSWSIAGEQPPRSRPRRSATSATAPTRFTCGTGPF